MGHTESGDDQRWLARAIELSARCEPSLSAFCVGAILLDADGRVAGQGYSRQEEPLDHAEEVALRAATLGGADLSRATLYSSLEPCLRRVSRPVPCAELVLRSGIKRVVIAWREPPVFQPGGGANWLIAHGVEVVELPELAQAARAVNAAVLNG